MKAFLERLTSGEVLVSDGGMGTLVMGRGLEPGACPEAINIDEPEILEEIAEMYLGAGADLVQTNTFGGSPMKLADFGLEDECERVNVKAVSIVKNVVQGKAYVLASCGPSGKILKPYGDTDPETLSVGFQRQIAALVEAGADIICVETMMDLQEAGIAVMAARRVSPTIPIVATMTFNETPKGFFTMMGTGIREAAGTLEQCGANVVGSNCGNGIEAMTKIARDFKEVTKLPVIIQSNAGIPETKEGKLFYPETPEFFGKKIPVLLVHGVSIVGGCCGTTPQHIKAVRKAVDFFGQMK